MKIKSSLRVLMEKPFFTSKEAKALGIHPANLSYYAKKGLLKRICRGVYQNTKYQSKTIKWEDLIKVVYCIHGGVICLISALALYELIEEIPSQHWIGIKHTTTAKAPDDVKIVRFRNMWFGKVEIDLDGIKVPIFDCERTIIDAFRLLSQKIAIKALKIALSSKKVDPIKLQDYAKKLRVNIDPYLITLTT